MSGPSSGREVLTASFVQPPRAMQRFFVMSPDLLHVVAFTDLQGFALAIAIHIAPCRDGEKVRIAASALKEHSDGQRSNGDHLRSQKRPPPMERDQHPNARKNQCEHQNELPTDTGHGIHGRGRRGVSTDSQVRTSTSLLREPHLQLNARHEGQRVEHQRLTDLSTELPKSQGLEKNGRRERFSAVRPPGQVPSFRAKCLRHSAISSVLESDRESSLRGPWRRECNAISNPLRHFIGFFALGN
jgi:hypothetical protein